MGLYKFASCIRKNAVMKVAGVRVEAAEEG